MYGYLLTGKGGAKFGHDWVDELKIIRIPIHLTNFSQCSYGFSRDRPKSKWKQMDRDLGISLSSTGRRHNFLQMQTVVSVTVIPIIRCADAPSEIFLTRLENRLKVHMSVARKRRAMWTLGDGHAYGLPHLTLLPISHYQRHPRYCSQLALLMACKIVYWFNRQHLNC